MDEVFFCKEKFREHYAKSRIIAVPSISSREFGVGFVDKIDFRHKSFATSEQLTDFLARDAPFYVSYSTARYELPEAKPMGKKGFLGADLVFDLDRQYGEEHAENHNNVFCLLCLERARQDATRFLEEFLLGDFGFSKGDVSYNYSGSKGFHFHVRSDSVQQLSSDARRELCDYAAAFEVNAKTILSRSVLEGKRTQHSLRGPSVSSRGWQKKVFLHAKNFCEKASEKDFQEMGAKQKAAKAFVADRAAAMQKLSEGNWDYIAGMEPVFEKLVDQCVAEKRIELDKPVSFDRSRLIRVPNSLHGDTGLIAKTLSSLEKFSPDRDAVVFHGSQHIIPSSSFQLDFNNASYSFVEKEGKEVSLAVAVLLLRKHKALLP